MKATSAQRPDSQELRGYAGCSSRDGAATGITKMMANAPAAKKL